MRLRKVEVGPLQTNSYIIISEGKALVIDPGAEAEKILSILKEEEADLEYIIYTHAHYDHTSASGPLKDATGAQVAIGAAEKVVFDDPTISFRFLASQEPEPAEPDIFLKEGDFIRLGEIELKVLNTPGHTPGGISLLLESEKTLFSGDALFAGSVGRTDFPLSSHDQLLESIRSRILVLDDDVKVLPGHGSSTTVGRERRRNPFLR